MNSLNEKVILPGQTVGIIGGGQLGRMMALYAKSAGLNIAVIDPAENGPLAQVADVEIIGAYDDMLALEQLAEASDVITYEFENISSEALDWLKGHTYLPQGSELLRMTQDRITEKKAIREAGAMLAPYFEINELQDVYDKIDELGYPSVLKTSRGGYDGKGQLVIRKQEEIAMAAPLLKHGACVLEAWVPYKKEISVIVARKENGEMSYFPVAENLHVENILHQTIVPARISAEAEKKALEMAGKLAESAGLVGSLAVEMFLTEDDSILINELAPRPHNSGHYTIEACETSQFEQHIRAICNWPLGSTELMKPAVMVNILGQHIDPIMKAIPGLKDWNIHLYGKKEAKHNRKMGHVTLLRESIEAALSEIRESGIWPRERETEDQS
ncbi:5-(carboxyamino)imidazole ribonucleotide synthase [Bacillus sp. OV322]|uniref:5-(carboxyamino)imidazole ribonucleotide synthase n=1 Tax=Bacillus sp. OV322 TaxID=1882764 RepID=UPI0008E2424C|nr:5-(carboxyamino)imidazole ribonucleotide synthase [Bacillus sp. OV322]SFC90203.1 5-(carboxyamino)imidazole ribonucleotide synthase [Bacillus sp. OV322]